MRARIGRVVAAAPADTWFFLSVSAFALVLTGLYWFWTYEWAGTILLFGFSLATGTMGLRLLLGRPPRRSSEERRADDESRREAAERERGGRASGAVELAAASGQTPPADASVVGDGRRTGSVPWGATRPGSASPLEGPGPTVPGASTGPGVATPDTGGLAPASPDADRPFLDETGRIPAPTIAPLAIALAAALVVTSIVLGPWLIIAAVLPLAWGAIGWIRDAGAEFRAVDAEDLEGDASPAAAGLPSAPSAPPGRPEPPARAPGADPASRP